MQHYQKQFRVIGIAFAATALLIVLNIFLLTNCVTLEHRLKVITKEL